MKTKMMPGWVINLFFVTGLVSALLFRILIFVNSYWPDWSRVVWYCGVLGYILFFAFRFFISFRRRAAIRENNLIEKLEQSDLNENDKDEVIYIMTSIMKSREMINYIFIFSVSGISIIVDLLLLLLK